MLRIGRGIWRGQVLRPDLKGVRPTPSRVREALLNIIYAKLPGAVVWDLFSGSGAFGISCASCGAEKVCFVDKSNLNLRKIHHFFYERNVSEKCFVLKGSIPACLNRIATKPDIIFLDPPYADSDIYSWIKRENWKSLLNSGGLVIVESGGEVFDEPWKVRKYGDTTISILEV